ncbi:hypothetical protein [Staphylococcus lutrae]|nr:hypothetical protein [Staphylococcus lutrae]
MKSRYLDIDAPIKVERVEINFYGGIFMVSGMGIRMITVPMTIDSVG